MKYNIIITVKLLVSVAFFARIPVHDFKILYTMTVQGTAMCVVFIIIAAVHYNQLHDVGKPRLEVPFSDRNPDLQLKG